MSQKVLSARVQDHFQSLPDPRRLRVMYPLINVVMIALCAVICGADDFVAIAEFGRQKKKWFAKFLDLKAGIPSHDRFNAIFAAIKPAEFEKCLLSWITDLQEITAGQVIAIDGKTLRRSYDTASSKAAIHMVSAWATANCISLGQVVVDAKSNEITAIPQLLEILDVSGCLVTIDAMGCQTEIAAEIVAGGGDYVLAVKDNQPTLSEGIREFFDDHMEDDFARTKISRHQTDEKGHGREELRSYYVCSRSGQLARPRALDQADGDRHGHQRHAARRQGVVGNSVLHSEQDDVGASLRRGGARTLGNRESFALATRCHLRRRSITHSPRPRRCQLQHPAGARR